MREARRPVLGPLHLILMALLGACVVTAARAETQAPDRAATAQPEPPFWPHEGTLGSTELAQLSGGHAQPPASPGAVGALDVTLWDELRRVRPPPQPQDGTVSFNGVPVR